MTATSQTWPLVLRWTSHGAAGLVLGFASGLLALWVTAWLPLGLLGVFALAVAVFGTVAVLVGRTSIPLGLGTFLGGVGSCIGLVWLTIQVTPDW